MSTIYPRCRKEFEKVLRHRMHQREYLFYISRRLKTRATAKKKRNSLEIRMDAWRKMILLE